MIAKNGTKLKKKKSMNQLKEANNCTGDDTWLEQKAQGWHASN